MGTKWQITYNWWQNKACLKDHSRGDKIKEIIGKLAGQNRGGSQGNLCPWPVSGKGGMLWTKLGPFTGLRTDDDYDHKKKNWYWSHLQQSFRDYWAAWLFDNFSHSMFFEICTSISVWIFKLWRRIFETKWILLCFSYMLKLKGRASTLRYIQQ